jgi:hypothetical protein
VLEELMLKKCVVIAALALVLAPVSARADWLFTPNLGTTFGGAASDREHLTYGVSIGWMGAGVIGLEGDFQFTPEFFEPNDDRNGCRLNLKEIMQKLYRIIMRLCDWKLIPMIEVIYFIT